MYVSKYKGFQNFKTSYALTIKYIWKSKEILKLSLTIRICLSYNRIQLLQKQFVNYFLQILRETTEVEFLYFRFSQKIWQICTLL